MDLTPLDWAMVIGYLMVVAGIGVAVSRKATDGDELFLAGRSLGFAVIGFSLFASNISSTTLIGLSGAAYASGISVANYEWMAGLLFLFMALFTIPVFVRAPLTTMPEYLERRFGRRSRLYFSGLTIFLSIFVDTAASVYAGVLVVQTFAPGAPFLPTCIALALFAGVYTAFGGLRAVVYTDVIQAIILLAGSCALTYAVFAAFDFSWEAATAAVPEANLKLLLPNSSDVLPWLGTMIGVPILGFYYWSTNQYIMQRVLGARSVDHARWGAALAGLLKLLPLFVMVLPGAMALTLFPGLENPDQVFPTLVGELLPAGFKGLVLAGLVAAIMSTIDSTLNSASTLIVHDFADARGKGWSARRTLMVGRIATAAFIAVAAFWPLVIRDFPGLFSYIQQVFAYAVPPVVAIFLLGLFSRRMTGRAAFATLLFGHGIGAVFFALRAYWAATGAEDPLPHFTILAGLTTLACIVFARIACLFDAAPDPSRLNGLVWRPAMIAPDRAYGVLADYRTHVIAVAALTLACVWAFA